MKSWIWWKWKAMKRFALAINCWFQMSIYFEILVFYISKLSYLPRGMYGHNVVWGLKAEDCSISNWKWRGYWWVLCINCHLYHITTWIWPPLFIEIHIIWNTLYASCLWIFRFLWKIFCPRKSYSFSLKPLLLVRCQSLNLTKSMMSKQQRKALNRPWNWLSCLFAIPCLNQSFS